MHPEWWPIQGLHRQGRPGDDESRNEHHEEGGSIGGIGKRIIEPASLATRTQLEKPLEQPAFAATWAATRQPRDEGGRFRIGLVGHAGNLANSPAREVASVDPVLKAFCTAAKLARLANQF